MIYVHGGIIERKNVFRFKNDDNLFKKYDERSKRYIFYSVLSLMFKNLSTERIKRTDRMSSIYRETFL